MTRLRDLFRSESGDRQIQRSSSPGMLAEARTLREAAIPVMPGEASSHQPLIDVMKDKRFVLLGEATHGTREFYEVRAHLSRRLIEEHGFAGIVAEADWPDAARVHRYLRGAGDDENAREALGAFERFPLWMWRNTVVLKLIEDLRIHNDGLRDERAKVGFWGMDLYSLYGSMAAVLTYLQKVDPAAAKRARQRYACFEPFGGDPQAYGAAAATTGASFDGDGDGDGDCEEQSIAQLADLLRRRCEYAQALCDEPGDDHDAGDGRGRRGRREADEFFFAEQNARLIANAEQYYRAMYRGGANTWNLRDTHMADTLGALAEHLARTTDGGNGGGGHAKLIVWAHNSHLGDARHTEMGGARGEVNVGQLLRERYDQAVFNLGFTTHVGAVTAAHNWDEPPLLMRVNPSRADSIEHLCHLAALRDLAAPDADDLAVDLPAFALMPAPGSAAADVLERERLERAIGVIYRPATERWSHYFSARPGRQFDAILHVDETGALQPLDPFDGFHAEHAEAPETYPSGL